jgi:drug/metabolite transporter (DMT)-like permease
MISSHPGEFAALLTAIFWTFTALAFTAAGKRVGSLAVNFWRLIVGGILLVIFLFMRYDLLFDASIDAHSMLWLALSGITGIFLGDLFLFKAFTITGPRVALLIMSLSPPMAALFAWLFLDDIISWKGVLGMCITMTGIVLVILKKQASEKIGLRYSPKGIFFAFLGAIGQAAGIVMSKEGMPEGANAFAATQIRVIAGLAGFILLITVIRRWKSVFCAVKDMKAMGTLSIGAFFGPFLGISFSLIAVSYTNPGIVQTITSANPVLIIPFSIWLFKEKVSVKEVIGAFIAVAGVALFFVG